eukprot:g56200.t1
MFVAVHDHRVDIESRSTSADCTGRNTDKSHRHLYLSAAAQLAYSRLTTRCSRQDSDSEVLSDSLSCGAQQRNLEVALKPKNVARGGKIFTTKPKPPNTGNLGLLFRGCSFPPIHI